MILIRVELHSAVTGKVTEIGRMKLTNDGSGDLKTGNYDVYLMRRGTTDKVQRTGRVEKHARKALSIWTLVSKALKAVEF